MKDNPREPKIKEQKFRSENRGVNHEYDMMRVTIDMPLRDWRRKRKEIMVILRGDDD